MIEEGWQNDSRVGAQKNGCVITFMREPTEELGGDYRIYDLNDEYEFFFESAEEMDYFIANGDYPED